VLPALILVIKESNPPGLHTALETVQAYRLPRKLHVSEAAYVFTNVVSAVHFLETVIEASAMCCAAVGDGGWNAYDTIRIRVRMC